MNVERIGNPTLQAVDDISIDCYRIRKNSNEFSGTAEQTIDVRKTVEQPTPGAFGSTRRFKRSIGG